MSEESSTDITIEALEVLINHILYIREAYPKEIFQKKKMYNLPIFVSIYPNLNDYLFKVLNIARTLKALNQLNKVEVLLYKNENHVYETYAFDIQNKTDEETTNRDQYLMDLEEQLRRALYTLSERVMSFPKLPEDARVKLQLCTNQSSYVKIRKESCKDVPWLQVSMCKQLKEQATIPVMDLSECGINVSINTCNQQNVNKILP